MSPCSFPNVIGEKHVDGLCMVRKGKVMRDPTISRLR
jgi:hypothetical protein